MTNAKIGKVQIPLLQIAMAIPAAVKAAHEAAQADMAPDSAGGQSVTAGEVVGVVGAFLLALGEAVTPAILAANGVS